jgi:hypothetical protein
MLDYAKPTVWPWANEGDMAGIAVKAGPILSVISTVGCQVGCQMAVRSCKDRGAKCAHRFKQG